MDSKQKQRIVGIIFLVILAVVAIPAFLKHSKENAVSPNGEEAQQMAQEQIQALPNEPAPLPDTNQPPVTDQEPINNAAPNPAPAAQTPSAITAPPADANMTQEQSFEPMPSEAQALPSQPSANTTNQSAIPAAPPPAIITPESTSPTSPAQPIIAAPSAAAPISAAPEPIKTEVVKPEPVKKPVTLKKANKTEHHVEKSDWTIRLAILSVRANADKLVKDLKKQGYHASIEEINTYKGMTYKVTLKTKSSRADADKLATRLNNSFHINVMVSRTR